MATLQNPRYLHDFIGAVAINGDPTKPALSVRFHRRGGPEMRPKKNNPV
jgi:hypothetical protein